RGDKSRWQESKCEDRQYGGRPALSGRAIRKQKLDMENDCVNHYNFLTIITDFMWTKFVLPNKM
ncbi:TPA: hypothetical protein ACLAVG_002119, partial [Neisseria meningitidis]